MAAWSEGYWQSSDGLRLHYRDYPGQQGGPSAGRPPILCIAGLTRNARDFEAVAERLSPLWRLICVDLRGRGESAHSKDPMQYVPATYVADLEALIETLGLDRFILFGTSLGGLLTMRLALRHRDRIAAALINDIGPVLEPGGIERIRSYIGRSQTWPTWLHAARHFADLLGATYPKWGLDQWLVFAKRVCKLSSGGRVVLDYDMRIAEPFRAAGGEGGASDPWAGFEALRGIPLLAVRGALSDLLSAEGLAEMEARMPQMDSVTIANVGHPPTLDEPEAQAAIDRLLKKVAIQAG